MTMKRSMEEMSQGPASDLSKTERRRLAKKAKKERERQGKGGRGGGGVSSGAGTAPGRPAKKGPKPKMTKEERRAKYTQKAYEAREKQNQLGPGANKTRCLGCRAWGHIVANCPEAKAATGICFNCGSTKHALRVCPAPKQKDGSLPHATCFVCKAKGHISAHCKQNANGVYPKGGFCKWCASKHHLSWDCPESTKVDKKKLNNNVKKDDAVGTASADAVVPDPGDSGADGGRASKDARGGGGKAERSTGGGGAVGGRAEEVTPKRRKATGSYGASSARGSKRVPALRIGGDDLEDDGYFDPDDVPDASFEHPDGTEEQLGSGSSGGVARQASGKGGSSAKRKLSSKVVVF
ncbi:unnamed protein product [Ectocarpus sp. 4 AP-2014]